MKGESILGIDPGKTGGLVLLSPAGSILRKEVIPVNGKEVDLDRLAKLFYELSDLVRVAYLEKVQGTFFSKGVRQFQGTASQFEFGRSFGTLEGMLAAFRIPYELVRAQQWQGAIHIGTNRKDPAKIRSKQAVVRLFPRVDLRENERCRVPHDGLVDALLIAEFGRRRMMGAGA